AERTAARVLARALSTAGVRDRIATKTTSLTPPGRLRMRGALAADAQRAAGALPTAEPFTRTTRTTVPTPPLRLGIACDVSGSMRHLAPAVASTAWILAHAAHHTTVPADTATVIFGHHVRPITRPGSAPTEVTEFEARDNWEDIPTAIDALDGALGLSRPGAARLLVIISDGHFREDPRREGQQRLDRLRATGCGVLWLSTDTTDTPLDGVTVHLLTDPAATAHTIGHAVTVALRATH
ncbi:MAG: VWA domain-containing protein, partial [Candidatus Dormibacteria bacterium]